VSKVDLRLQCGMPCSKLEVSTVQHGTLSGAGYLHQSHRPHHLAQRWITYHRRVAVGDLFLGQYPALIAALRSTDDQLPPDAILTKDGNSSLPFASAAGHILTCLPSCHCSISPVMKPAPVFSPCTCGSPGGRN
jgi:hypothetical protein